MGLAAVKRRQQGCLKSSRWPVVVVASRMSTRDWDEPPGLQVLPFSALSWHVNVSPMANGPTHTTSCGRLCHPGRDGTWFESSVPQDWGSFWAGARWETRVDE